MGAETKNTKDGKSHAKVFLHVKSKRKQQQKRFDDEIPVALLHTKAMSTL